MPEGMTTRRPYPSDLSDARWALVEPTLAAWRERERRAGPGIGRPPRHDLRCILDAILYVDRTGIPWRYLPHEYPPWQTVYYYFARWQEDEIFEQLNGLLRRLTRIAGGRDPEPTACVIDSQSVKTAATVPAATQGTDAAKKIVGRKRSIITDTLGLLLAVLVTAASVQDRDAGHRLVALLRERFSTITLVWADGGYAGRLVSWATTVLAVTVTIVKRTDELGGFVVLPRRWVVERTFGWLNRHRRLVRDYERRPEHHEAMLLWATTMTMTRQLVRQRAGEPPRPRWGGDRAKPQPTKDQQAA